MEIAILIFVLSLSQTRDNVRLPFGWYGRWDLNPQNTEFKSVAYAIRLLPHIPGAATKTIPLFLLDLHFAGRFEVAN